MTEKETVDAGEGGQETRSHCFCMGFGPEISEMLRRMGPPEAAREHFRNARIEVLKGIRTMIDNRIDELSRAQKKGTTIVVE